MTKIAKHLVLDTRECVQQFKKQVSAYLTHPEDIVYLVNQAVDAAIDSLETMENGPELETVIKLHFRKANLGLLHCDSLIDQGKLTCHGMTLITEFNILYLSLFSLLKSLSSKLIDDYNLRMKVFPYFFEKLKSNTVILSRFN